jgi:hypothetical protein
MVQNTKYFIICIVINNLAYCGNLDCSKNSKNVYFCTKYKQYFLLFIGMTKARQSSFEKFKYFFNKMERIIGHLEARSLFILSNEKNFLIVCQRCLKKMFKLSTSNHSNRVLSLQKYFKSYHLKGRYDTRQNDTRHNDIQYNQNILNSIKNTQYNDTQH